MITIVVVILLCAGRLAAPSHSPMAFLGSAVRTVHGLGLSTTLPWDRPAPPSPGEVRPTPTPGGSPPARPLVVQVDAAGQPYDVPMPDGAWVTRERFAVLHAPSDRVQVISGETLPFPDATAPITLAPRTGHDYPIEVIWLHAPSRPPVVAGVLLHEDDTPVARWAELREAGYGTDGGMGAITTPEWSTSTDAHLVAVRADNAANKVFDDFIADEEQIVSADLDGVPGVDSILFGNGFGDGGFPGVAGYDADGHRVVVLVWHLSVPWRVAVPDGVPPEFVTTRERELADCLGGVRQVEGSPCVRERP